MDSEEWKQIAAVKDSLAYTYTEIKKGVNYRFRVRAINVHGPSPPSEESDNVIIEEFVTGIDNI